MRKFSEIILPLLLAIVVCVMVVSRAMVDRKNVEKEVIVKEVEKEVIVKEVEKGSKAKVQLPKRPPRGKMISIKPHTHLYPMPLTIVGANVKGKPNFLAIAYAGACCYYPPMMAIGINKKHYTTKGILENNTFSINIPSQDMMGIADYVGLVSGHKVDKSKLFKTFYGKLKTAPIIQDASIAMECKVFKVIDTKGSNYVIIGQVMNTWADENVLTRKVPDLAKIDPVIFSLFQNHYWKLGPKVGKAWHEGINYAKKHGLKIPKARDTH